MKVTDCGFFLELSRKGWHFSHWKNLYPFWIFWFLFLSIESSDTTLKQIIHLSDVTPLCALNLIRYWTIKALPDLCLISFGSQKFYQLYVFLFCLYSLFNDSKKHLIFFHRFQNSIQKTFSFRWPDYWYRILSHCTRKRITIFETCICFKIITKKIFRKEVFFTL